MTVGDHLGPWEGADLRTLDARRVWGRLRAVPVPDPASVRTPYGDRPAPALVRDLTAAAVGADGPAYRQVLRRLGIGAIGSTRTPSRLIPAVVAAVARIVLTGIKQPTTLVTPMRWIVQRDDPRKAERLGRVVGAARTKREATGLGRDWLDQHPESAGCWMTDTRTMRRVQLKQRRT